MYTARKMRAVEYKNHQEQMSAAQGEQKRQFCVEHSCGKVSARLLTWAQACYQVERLNSVETHQLSTVTA
jgi:hypothetical protein